MARADSAVPGLAPGGTHTYTQEVPFDFSGFDFNDFSEGAGAAGRRAGGGGFRDIFSSIFGGGRGEAMQERPEPGSDLEYQVNVGFWQAIKGTVMKLNIPHLEVCGELSRARLHRESRRLSGMQRQRTDHAEERQHEVQRDRARAAAAAARTAPCATSATAKAASSAPSRWRSASSRARATASAFALPGRGNAGTMGAPAGDLYIIVRAGEHPVFKRDGDDIYLTVPVTFTEAGLGGKIEVPTIDGRALLKIPPGTQCGQKLRLREKGVPSAVKEGTRGDEIVEIKIVPPNVRDERSKEILRELAKLNPEDPREQLWKQV